MYGGCELDEAVELDLLEPDTLWCERAAGAIPLNHESCEDELELGKAPQFEVIGTEGLYPCGIFFAGSGGGLLPYTTGSKPVLE